MIARNTQHHALMFDIFFDRDKHAFLLTLKNIEYSPYLLFFSLMPRVPLFHY